MSDRWYFSAIVFEGSLFAELRLGLDVRLLSPDMQTPKAFDRLFMLRCNERAFLKVPFAKLLCRLSRQVRDRNFGNLNALLKHKNGWFNDWSRVHFPQQMTAKLISPSFCVDG